MNVIQVLHFKHANTRSQISFDDYLFGTTNMFHHLCFTTEQHTNELKNGLHHIIGVASASCF